MQSFKCSFSQSNESMVHVANLTHSTTYNVSVMLINGELEYSVPSNNGQLFRTQPPNMRPGDVKNIKFGKFVDRMMPDGQTTLSVNVSWEPSEGKCYLQKAYNNLTKNIKIILFSNILYSRQHMSL